MKKKTKLLSLISTTLAGLALSLGVVSGVSSEKTSVETNAYYSPSTHYEVSDTASELASYYSSISDSDSGTSLLSKLQSLNSSKRKKTMGYSTIGTDMSGAVIYTDYDLNNTAKDSNGQTYGTKVASFYTKTAATSWNREHMWPNSHGGNNVEADILHTRPTISSENSSRGNSFYVEGKNNSSSGWDPYTAGYAEWCRGECARVILYCVVAYPSFTLSDADSHSTSNSNKDNMMGNMNTLIKWHFNYLPNVYEKNRNDGAEYLQGNRNPFVDHPEYVARIWSSFNSTVSSLCSSNSSTYSNWVPGNYCNFGSNTPVQSATGVSISASTASVSVGSTTTLSATSTDSGTISWTTSDSSVASISSASSSSGANITITGVSAGTATITAKRTISGQQYSATCTVTVTKVVSSLSKGSTSPSKTTYTAGESFNPGGLTITANYNDSTSEDVTNSVVWTPDPLTAGTTSVTGTFGGKSITITGLTVNEAAQPESYSIVPSDLANGTYPTSATSYTAASGISVTAMNTANFSSKIQFKKSGGYLYNNSSLNLGTLTLSGVSGSLTVYAGTSKNPSSTTISGSNGVYDLSGYNYFKIINNSGSVATCSSISVGLAQQAKTLSSISVYESPDKLSYTAGEYFDPTGLEITRAYSDGTEDNYAYAGHTSEFTFSPTTSTALTTSNVSVTITYGGKSCSQAITVNAAKTLSSISVSTAPNKTTYTAGEMFDPTGLVIRRNYSDSTYDTYTYSGHTSEFTFSPSTSTALTTSNVSVTITYGGKSTSQAITVNAAAAKTLSSITISGYKTSFTLDESFSFGGTVTANFSDSTSSNVTASATFSGYNMSVPGNYTVTVSYTYGGTTKTATYSITVTASGGSGGTEEGSQRISASTTSTYYESGDICPTGSTSSASATCDAFDVSWLKNSSSNSIAYTYAEIRVYASHSFTITPKEGYTITTIVITANSSSYASAVGGSSLTNCTKNVSSSTVTLTPTDGTSAVGFTNTAQSRLNYIVVNYEYESSGSTEPTLSSISLDTSNVTTQFQVNATFTYSGLVVTAHYSDSTSAIVTPTSVSTPDMSTTGNKTVTVTYLTASNTYSITVSSAAATSITATVSKTYYVGDTISSSDIIVKDNLNNDVNSFTFANDGYQFTYADAASGGALTNKTFTNAVSGSNLTCSLTVQVQRKARVDSASASDSVTYTDLPTTYQTSTTERTAESGIKFIAYNLANYSSKMQFRASGGYFQTTEAMSLTSLTINNRETNALSVYGSTNGTSFSTSISGTNDVYDLTGYSYVKVMRNGSGAAYCASLTITYGGGDSALNLANYIMYEDTTNQCTTKLDTAIGYLAGLSSTERSTFSTSTDYVVSTAKERLDAWALNQGKQVNYENGELVNRSNMLSIVNLQTENNSPFILIVLLTTCGFTVTLLYLKRKRHINNL